MNWIHSNRFGDTYSFSKFTTTTAAATAATRFHEYVQDVILYKRTRRIDVNKGSEHREFSLSLSLSVSTLCVVWKFSCIKFQSLIHAYMYINNACNLISVHQ